MAAYVKYMDYEPQWITGTAPGSVYYVYDPATRTRLAWAGFEPAPNAPLRVFVGLQDAGYMTPFHQPPNQPWSVYDICTTPAFKAFVPWVDKVYGSCPSHS